MSNLKPPCAWMFKFNNGTTVITKDKAEADRIRPYLEVGDSCTELCASLTINTQGMQPSVPDSKTLQFLTDVLTAAGLLRHGKKDAGLATRIADESCRIRQQLFTQPAQPADLVRDAERYRWLRECYWNDSPLCVVSKPKSNCLPGAYFPPGSFLDEEIDAAIERDKMKGGAE